MSNIDLNLLYLQEMVRNGQYNSLTDEEKNIIKDFYQAQIKEKKLILNMKKH